MLGLGLRLPLNELICRTLNTVFVGGEIELNEGHDLTLCQPYKSYHLLVENLPRVILLRPQ